MGNVIVAALLIIGTGIAAGLVVITQAPTLETSVDSVIQSQINVADIIRSDIEIVSAEPDQTGRRIDVWLKNAGSLHITPVSSLDVILKSSDGRRGEYVPHGASSGNRWVVVPASQQVWHSGRTLQLQITLAVPLTSGVYILSVTTPQGVSSDQSFEMAALVIPVPRVTCGVAFTSCEEVNEDIYTTRGRDQMFKSLYQSLYAIDGIQALIQTTDGTHG